MTPVSPLVIAIHIMYVGLTIGVKCPDSSQWKLRGSGYCNHTHPWYNCLYDENHMMYTELCRNHPDFQRPGYKLIIRGDLDGKPCDNTYYQPIKFWTNGSSHCIFKKSNCNEEGQLDFDNGDGISNRQCRCDYTAGYAFVTKPKATCFCNPEQEDCTCYLMTCKPLFVLTPDYECIRQIKWSGDFKCPLQEETSLNEEQTTKSTGCPFSAARSNKKEDEYEDMQTPTFIAILVLLITFVMLLTICKKCLRKSIEKCRDFLQIEEHIAKGVQEGIKQYITGGQNDSRVLTTECGGLYNDKIPKDMRDLYERYLMEWQENDKQFVVTDATMQVKKLLRTENCVLLVGPPGSGKSSILKHTAIELCNHDGFDVIPIVMTPSSILQYYNGKRKQIFVIDDLCGKHETCLQSFDMWALQIERILKLLIIDITETIRNPIGNFKLLISCSSCVYNDKNFMRLEIPKKYVCILSNFKLNNEQMLEMMSNFRNNDFKTSLKDYKPSNDFEFHLLVMLCKGRNGNEQVELLSDPLNFIMTDLTQIRDNQIFEFCAIAFCVLFNNSFKEEMFDYKVSYNFVAYLAESYFKSMLKKGFLLTSIKKALSQLEENRMYSYIRKTGHTYHFVHERIFDIAATFCGQTFLHGFITCASSKFISERYSLATANHKQMFIVINEEDLKKYFDRLIKDLSKGTTCSTFHNKLLQNISFRQTLSSYYATRELEIIELFEKLNSTATSCSKPVEKVDTNKPLDLKKDSTYHRQKMFSDYYECRMPLIESVWSGYPELIELALTMKCDVNATDKFNRSPLCIASFLGNLENVKLLLARGAKICVCDIYGRSPLYVACEEGRNAVVEYIGNSDANIILKCDQNKCSPIFVASATGHKNVVQYLISMSKSNISEPDSKGQTPLFVASLRGRNDIVRLLLRNNADIDRPDIRGRSPLFIASMNGHWQVVKNLLDKNAKTSQCDHDGRSPLFIACQEGHLKTVKHLLEYDTNCLSVYEWRIQSPMLIACSKGHIEIVKFLVNKNTDINKCDEDGKSPLFIACEKGNKEVVNFLLEKGAIIEKLDNDERSPFYVASRSGNVEIMKLLLLKGANPSHSNKWGGSVLNITCREGQFHAVKLLLEKGVDHSKKDAIGNSPLYIAAEEGHAEIVEILLKYEANINITNKENMTPLHVACEQGRTKVVQILLKNQAKTNLNDKKGNTPKDYACNQKHISIMKLFDT